MLGSRNVPGLKGHLEHSCRTAYQRSQSSGWTISSLYDKQPFVRRFRRNYRQYLSLALFTNLLNLLDLRPGRAIKFYLCLLFILGLSSFFTGAHHWFALMLPLIGTVIGYFPFDLKACSMMGDAGSNVLGISVGMLAVSQLDYQGKLIVLVFLILIHWFTEKYSLSTIIANNRLLACLITGHQN